MKKRILSLVLCAVMLLSMCLFMGAGVTADTADTVDTTETAAAAETANIVSFTNAGPLVKPEQTAGPARARALAANDTGSGVQLDKTVTKDENSDTYTVRLEAYATGEQTTTVSTKPCDIVLVLDVSGSMDKAMSRYDSTKKLTALKNAVNNFIDQVAAKETDGVTHRISIVKFAGETTDKVGNDTYDVTTGSWPFEETNTYNYSQIVKGLTDAKSGQTKLKEAVNALKAAGATSADYGMEHAQTVLAGARSDATKVVVMFTDGEPNHYSGFDQDVADAAISAAKSLKADGATVYTVGCMSGADASRVADISTLGNKNVNKYMHLVSSNYKNAERMDKPGVATYPKNENESYYLTAKTADELNNAFESINKQTGGSSTELTSTAVLQDAVTPYFEIPDGASAQVTLKTADYGVKDDGTLGFSNEKTITDGSVKATVKDNAVSVTGFDYSANWCGPRTDAAGSTTYSGQKLIVEFTIQPTAAFLGGNGVQTNVGTADGIYAPGGTTPVEKFQPQNVDVTVKAVEPTTTDTEIYLGKETNLADRISTNIPQLDRVNNAYVDVTYTVKDENGTVVGTYTVPAGSSEGTWAWTNGSNVKPDKTTTYTVTSTSTPKTGNMTNTASVEKQFTITVKTCSLKITKTVTGDGANPNQTFVFNVMKGNDLVTTVVLKAGQSTTITGLAVGDYTVVEDTNWSWSYTAEGDGTAKVTLDKDNGYDREAKITNTAKENHWLTSIVDVINKWTTKDGKTTIDNSGHVPAAKTN